MTGRPPSRSGSLGGRSARSLGARSTSGRSSKSGKSTSQKLGLKSTSPSTFDWVVKNKKKKPNIFRRASDAAGITKPPRTFSATVRDGIKYTFKEGKEWSIWGKDQAADWLSRGWSTANSVAPSVTKCVGYTASGIGSWVRWGANVCGLTAEEYSDMRSREEAWDEDEEPPDFRMGRGPRRDELDGREWESRGRSRSSRRESLSDPEEELRRVEAYDAAASGRRPGDSGYRSGAPSRERERSSRPPTIADQVDTGRDSSTRSRQSSSPNTVPIVFAESPRSRRATSYADEEEEEEFEDEGLGEMWDRSKSPGREMRRSTSRDSHDSGYDPEDTFDDQRDIYERGSRPQKKGRSGRSSSQQTWDDDSGIESGDEESGAYSKASDSRASSPHTSVPSRDSSVAPSQRLYTGGKLPSRAEIMGM